MLRKIVVPVVVLAGIILAQPVRDTFWLTMDDSVRIDCTRFTPAGSPPPGGYPAIIFVHGLGGSKTSSEPTAQSYATNGYVTLAYSVRGQGRSGGLSTCFSWRERHDLANIAAWLAAQPDVNDTLLGVCGGSQGGFHSWFGGVDRIPGVKAVAPANAIPLREDNDARYGCYGKAITAELNYSANLRLDTIAYPLKRLLRADNYDSVRLALVNGRSFDSSQVAASGASFLMLGAYHDHVFPHNRVPGAFAVAPNRSLMYLGTGGHGSENSPQENAYRTALTGSFLDERLKGVYRGLDTVGPAVIATGPDWRHYEFPSWPPAGLNYVDYWLHADGSMSTDLPVGDTAWRIVHQQTNPSYTWTAAVNDNFARATASFQRNRLSFRTAPLAGPVTIMGIPLANVWAEGPKPRFQVNLQLYDEQPGGQVTYLTQISLGSRDNPDSVSWHNLSGECTIVGWEIPALHRLRIDWTSINQTLSDTTLWWLPYWNANGTVRLGLDSLHPARISLPMLQPTGVREGMTHDALRVTHEMEVWPNPCRGALSLQVAADGPEPRLLIYDAAGKAAKTVDIRHSASRGLQSIDLRDLPDGVYLVTASDNSRLVGKIVLRR